VSRGLHSKHSSFWSHKKILTSNCFYFYPNTKLAIPVHHTNTVKTLNVHVNHVPFISRNSLPKQNRLIRGCKYWLCTNFNCVWICRSKRRQNNFVCEVANFLGSHIKGFTVRLRLLKQTVQESRSRHSQDQSRQCFCDSWLWLFDPKINEFPGLIFEHFCVKFGDTSCIGFWDIIWINRQTYTQTNASEGYRLRG